VKAKKKAYSKGSCSCGMAALTPGMLEFGAGSRIAELVGVRNPIKLLKGRSGLDAARNSLATKAREVRSIDRVRGESLKKALQAKRARVANEAKGIYQAQKSAAMGALREDSELIQGALGSKNYFAPSARKTKAVRSSYGLESLEFARGDRAIPALKKALAKGIGNAGEPVSISEIGVSGTMVPSMRGNAKNVQRATKKYWGEDEGLDQASGAMRYNRDWAAKTIKEDRSSRNMWPRRLRSEDSLPEPLRKARARSRMGMSALTPGMVAFALGEDNRPRNNNGQFLANETGGADPNSMQAAYGNVEAEKMARRQNLMGRLKAMMGR